jgi:hypothetical protein
MGKKHRMGGVDKWDRLGGHKKQFLLFSKELEISKTLLALKNAEYSEEPIFGV